MPAKIIISEKQEIIEVINRVKAAYSVSELIRKWGNAASIALLDPKCKIYRDPSIQGIIGYQIAWGCAVVYGDPVCATEVTNTIIDSFENFCKSKNLQIIYTTISHDLSEKLLTNKKGTLLKVGEELYINPQNDYLKGSEGRLLRKKLNKSLSSGLTVHEYNGGDRKLEEEMEEVKNAWLGARQGPQIYLSHINLFTDKIGKRWFYALQDNKVAGVLLLNQLESKDGWVLNMVMAKPNTPTGTSELLILQVLEQLKSEDCNYLTFGTLPTDNLEVRDGLGSVGTWIAKKAYSLSGVIFHLDSRKTYWKKFQPFHNPTYILITDNKISLRNTFAILTSLNFSLK